jgi:hypothetical protein
MVLYPTPDDIEAFDRAYSEEHAPMVNEKVPNKRQVDGGKGYGLPHGRTASLSLGSRTLLPLCRGLQKALDAKGGQV